MKPKIVVLPQEHRLATPWNLTLSLAFGTAAEDAQAPQIAHYGRLPARGVGMRRQNVPSAGGQHEHIDLVVGDAGAGRLEQTRHGKTSGAPEVAQPIGTAQPDRQIDVLALMQQLYAKPPQRLADDWLPKPKILHPWPGVRFAVRHSR